MPKTLHDSKIITQAACSQDVHKDPKRRLLPRHSRRSPTSDVSVLDDLSIRTFGLRTRTRKFDSANETCAVRRYNVNTDQRLSSSTRTVHVGSKLLRVSRVRRSGNTGREWTENCFFVIPWQTQYKSAARLCGFATQSQNRQNGCRSKTFDP